MERDDAHAFVVGYNGTTGRTSDGGTAADPENTTGVGRPLTAETVETQVEALRAECAEANTSHTSPFTSCVKFVTEYCSTLPRDREHHATILFLDGGGSTRWADEVRTHQVATAAPC